MDRGQQQGDPVAAGLATIKAAMPMTYADIQQQAAGPRGREAFALVRRSLKGEPDCFYAIEGGHVVGTPFDTALTTDVAASMVQFGAGFVVMWPLVSDAAPPVGTPPAPAHGGNSAPARALVGGDGKSERVGEQRGAK